MTLDKLLELLLKAYYCGLENGTGRSGLNFNDFINMPEIKMELEKLTRENVNNFCKHQKGSVIFNQDKVLILCKECGKLH